MKPNKVLAFAQAQTAKAWLKFQLTPPRPSMDPNQPAHYIVEAQGERGDGIVFAVVAHIDKAKFDRLQGAQALGVAQDLLNRALQQLQTYTGCACKESEPCEKHSEVVH